MTSAEILLPAKVITRNTIRLVGKLTTLAEVPAIAPSEAEIKVQAALENHRDLYSLDASFDGAERRRMKRSMARIAMRKQSGTQEFAVRELENSGMIRSARVARVVSAVRSVGIRRSPEDWHRTEELKESGKKAKATVVRAVGVIHAIAPKPYAEPEYDFAGGNHRLASVRDAFIDTSCPTPDEILQLSVSPLDQSSGAIPAMTPTLLAELDVALPPLLERARQHAAELEDARQQSAVA